MSWLGREMIVDSLSELASERLQRQRWLSDGSSEMSSFVEAVEQLFTDSGLEDAIEKGTSGYPDGVEHLFRELSKLVACVNGRASPAEIISDPKMALVRAKSSEILSALGD